VVDVVTDECAVVRWLIGKTVHTKTSAYTYIGYHYTTCVHFTRLWIEHTMLEMKRESIKQKERVRVNDMK